MAYFDLLLNIVFIVASVLLLTFGAFPNVTNNSGWGDAFEMTTSNIVIYIVIPFILGIISLALFTYYFLKSMKESKKWMNILLITLSAISFVAIIAFSIYLVLNAKEGWIGNYLNIGSIILTGASFTYLTYKLVNLMKKVD